MSFQQYVLPDLATLHASPFESMYHEYLYRNTFYPSEAVWNHPKLGPLFRCLKIHAQSTDREEFQTMLQQNPFLATEMIKGTTREKKREKKRKKKKNPQGETTETSSTVETKTEDTASIAACTEQKFNQDLQLLKENQVASFQNLLKSDANHVRETFNRYRQLWELRTTTVCAVERLKLLETACKKILESNEDDIDLVVEWEKHESNIRTTIRGLEPPTPLSPIAAENNLEPPIDVDQIQRSDLIQLIIRYDAIKSVEKRVETNRAILLSSWGLLKEDEEEIYFRIHGAMSDSAFAHGQTPNSIKKYIDFEISQQELLLCIQQATVDIVNDERSQKKTMLSAEIVNLTYAFDYEKNLTLVLKYEQKRR